ncbi:histidine phosphatase family protein [uncultured Ferrovibrio sp.]|uniref:histidine phosphatase family protein n=1 Tax=uncultured Ferrovibrio sp. TaxID=1576913 RepID=UPI00262A8CF8|nr:histidine phosphatase family protein [uncultured Ferrovibrio sp.]
MRRLIHCVVVLLLWPICPAVASDDGSLWQALRERRAAALIRHAEAPGIGDPPGFRLDDCSTQRNLSEAGRNQARRFGNEFRRNGVDAALVLSSAWCRAQDTARLLDLGRVEVAPALASLHGRPERRAAQMAELRALIHSLPEDRPVILISHHATIGAFTEAYPQNGEAIVIDRRSLAVLGRLRVP